MNQLPEPNHRSHDENPPVCNNPVWYALFGSTEERLAYVARIENERNEKRIERLLSDIEKLDKANDKFDEFLDELTK